MKAFIRTLSEKGYLLPALIAAAALVAVFRMIVVILWCVVAEHSPTENVVVEIALALFSNIILVAVCSVLYLRYASKLGSTITYDTLSSALTTYALSTLALLLVSALIPVEFDGIRPLNIVSVVAMQVVAIATYIVTVGVGWLVVYMLLARMHATTRLLLYVLGVIVALLWLSSLLEEHGGIVVAAQAFLVIAGILVLLTNLKRMQWLQTFTTDKKIRLLWICACAAFASATLWGFHTFSESSLLKLSAEGFVRGGSTVPAVLNLFAFVFFVRLFFAIVAALPNSSVVDRKRDEVQSLAALTKLVAEAGDVDSLLQNVTGYALRVCKAHGAWCEMPVQGKPVIQATQLVNPDYVHHLYANPRFLALLRTSQQPLFIESIHDSDALLEQTTVVRSLISIPFQTNEVTEEYGRLVVFSTIPFGFDPEDVRLLTAFADSITVALDQAVLLQNSIIKERLQQELDVARQMQASLLPKTSPTTSNLVMAGNTIPAEDVGGDYYDFVQYADGTFGAVIADVSGKGVPAGLYMATLKGVVLAHVRASNGPGDLLRRINATLYKAMERHVYITMACVSYNPVTSSVRIARAGHTPIVFCTSGKVCTLQPPGMAIGFSGSDVFDVILQEESVHVAAGDYCLLTTDGATERRNQLLEEIGIEALANGVFETFRDKRNLQSAQAVVDSVVQILDEHAQQQPAHDDITIVALTFS